MSSGLSIGVSALIASRRSLEVAGQNIANATNPAYRRRTADLREAATLGSPVGNGVRFVGARRVVDSQLEARLRDEQTRSEGLQDTVSRLQEVETVVGRLDNATLAEQLNELFQDAMTLTGAADQLPARAAFLDRADLLASEMRSTAAELARIRSGAARQAATDVAVANRMLSQVAELNLQISRAPSGVAPNDLLDQRDQALLELSRLGDVRTQATAHRGLSVTFGGATVVSGTRARSLELVSDPAGGFSVRTSSAAPLRLTGGRLYAQQEFATGGANRFGEDLDRLAQALIQTINGIQATGVPLGGPGQSLTSEVAVSDPLGIMAAGQVPLRHAGLVGELRSGAIHLRVLDDATGAATRYAVSFDASTDSLESLAERIRVQTPADAAVLSDGRLRLSAATGHTVDLVPPDGASADETGLLGALGFQALFTGSGAADLAVRRALRDDPSLLALSGGSGPGDGRNALRLAKLSSQELPQLDGFSLPGFLGRTIGGLGAEVSMQTALAEGSESLRSALEERSQGLSGVSIDEEVTRIVEFEQSYRAAARFLQTATDLFETLVNLGR